MFYFSAGAVVVFFLSNLAYLLVQGRQWSVLVHSGAGRRKAVLCDFPVQRPSTDLEHLRCFLLVPADGVEHPDDLGAFGFAERLKALTGGFPGRVPYFFLLRQCLKVV